MDFASIDGFWLPLLTIMGINILLSGDNAIVIALAAQALPPDKQKKAVFWGSASAVVFLIVLTIFASELLHVKYLKLVGSVLLLWIGIKLLVGEDEADEIKQSDNLGAAIKSILIANLVMSLDNILGVAAAAHGNKILMVIGLGVSIPVVIFGSTVLMKVMERFPVIILIGAALIGKVAGEMAVDDSAIATWIDPNRTMWEYGAQIAGALIVVVGGKLIEKRHTAIKN